MSAGFGQDGAVTSGDGLAGRSTAPAQRRRALASLIGSLALALGLGSCAGNSEGDTASLRLVNASTGYAALELLVNDVRRGAEVAQGTAGAYVGVTAEDPVSTKVNSAGSATALVSSSDTRLNKETAYSLVLYGYPGAPNSKLLTENSAAAASGRASLVVENLGSDAGALDVYLTGQGESIDAAVAVASGVAAGGTSAAVNVAAGTYRLRVTAAGDRSDLRLDVDGLSLASTQAATLLLSPSVGGVLVSGQLLVQKGTSTLLANRQARARVVAALAGNARITAAVGTVALASGLVAPNVGGYALVGAGDSVAWTLTVNGVAVPVGNLSLAAGADATVLVWGTAAAPRHAMFIDDSRYPSDSTRAKLRLVNGLAGNEVGLNLSADLSTRATNVAPGRASAYSLVTGSSAVRLDVSSPLVAAPLYSASAARIDGKGLYSVFMLGDAAAPSPLLVRER